MSREGSSRSFSGRVFAAHETLHGKGTAVLVFALFVAIAMSRNEESNGTALPTAIVGEYLELDNCLEENVAQDGLYAICTARDGSTWRVTQSEGQVFVPENAVTDSFYTVSEAAQEAKTSYSSVSFNKPLVVVPETSEQCEQSCAIAAKDSDQDWSFYAPSSPHVLRGINGSMTIVGIDVSQAMLIDPTRN